MMPKFKAIDLFIWGSGGSVLICCALISDDTWLPAEGWQPAAVAPKEAAKTEDQWDVGL